MVFIWHEVCQKKIHCFDFDRFAFFEQNEGRSVQKGKAMSTE